MEMSYISNCLLIKFQPYASSSNSLCPDINKQNWLENTSRLDINPTSTVKLFEGLCFYDITQQITESISALTTPRM